MLQMNRIDHEYYTKQVAVCTEIPHAPGEPHWPWILQKTSCRMHRNTTCSRWTALTMNTTENNL